MKERKNHNERRLRAARGSPAGKPNSLVGQNLPALSSSPVVQDCPPQGRRALRTCCGVEPAATVPSCFLSSSSSCAESLQAAAGALKLAAPPAALATSSARSLAFCCRYCSVWKHTRRRIARATLAPFLPDSPWRDGRTPGSPGAAVPSLSICCCGVPQLRRRRGEPKAARQPVPKLHSQGHGPFTTLCQSPRPRRDRVPLSIPSADCQMGRATPCTPEQALGPAEGEGRSPAWTLGGAVAPPASTLRAFLSAKQHTPDARHTKTHRMKNKGPHAGR